METIGSFGPLKEVKRIQTKGKIVSTATERRAKYKRI
jgi:hypothetical protein